MSFYKDEYKCHPCTLGGDKSGKMPNDSNHLAEQPSYLAHASHRGARWLPTNGRSVSNQSHPGYASYSVEDYLSNQASYANEDAAQVMPSLPAIGTTATRLYFPPNEEPETPHGIASKIASSDSFQSTGTNDHVNPIYRKSSYFSEVPSIAHVEGLASASGSSESSTMSAQQATGRPMPARSAFMMFSEAKRGEIVRMAEPNGKEGAVKAVARAWRSLSSSEKKYWDQMARQDKTRYNNDKKLFADTKLHGGSLVKKLRAKKHPNAPKRPMSAFLMYAQQQRKVLQAEFPDLPNADISKLLGETWRKLSDGEKLQFLMREQEERKVYRAKMSRWNNDQKLINSLKTASERRQQDNEEAYEYDERQDAEGVETVAALKYVAQPYNEPRCNQNELTPSYHSYGHVGHQQMWNGVNQDENLQQFSYHAAGSVHQQYGQLPSQHVRSQEGDQMPKLFSYPRPDEDYP